MDHYLLVVEGDIEPRFEGPFPTPDSRDHAAKQHRRRDPEMQDGLFMLEADVVDGKVKLEVDSYSAGFFEEDEDE